MSDTQSSTIPPNTKLTEFLDQVEKDLLFHIYENVKSSKTPPENAEQLARDFLTLLPPKDKQDLLAKLNALGEKYPEARATYFENMGTVEEEQRQQKLTAMRNHIKNGNIEAAIAITKGENKNE